MLSSFQHLKVRFKVGAIRPWTSVTVPHFMADPDRHADILLHHTVYMHSMQCHKHCPIERFHLPLTPRRPKHSPLGMAKLIPFTAVLGDGMVHPFRDGEYIYGRIESIDVLHFTIMLIPYLYKFFDHNNIILICGSSQHFFPLVVHIGVL